MLSSFQPPPLDPSESSLSIFNSTNGHGTPLSKLRKCSPHQQLRSIDSESPLVAIAHLPDQEQGVNYSADGFKEKEGWKEEEEEEGVKESTEGKTADDKTENERVKVEPPDMLVKVQCPQTQFGEAVYIIGEWVAWDTSRAVRLDGSEWPAWKASFKAQKLTCTEYKYYILGADGKTKVWESLPGGNRLFTGKRVVEDIFGQPFNQEQALAFSKTVDYPIPLVDIAKSQFKVTLAAFKGILAAMKTFPLDTVKAIKQAMNEAETLGCMDHCCIVRIFVAYYDSFDDVVVIVEEYMDRGSLSTLMYKENLQLNVIQKLRILLRLARAVEYIHSLGFIHRDIKSPNVLLNDELDAKLCDFGITRKEASIFDKMTKIGTPLWMAPEVFMSKHYDCKADIYSLGVVMYEVMEHELPSDRLDANFIRPNQNCLAPLIKQCLDISASNRPSATDVKTYIQVAIAEQCKRILSFRNMIPTREALVQVYEEFKQQRL